MAKSKANVHKEEGDLQTCPTRCLCRLGRRRDAGHPALPVCDTVLVLGIAGNCLLKEAGGRGGITLRPGCGSWR